MAVLCIPLQTNCYRIFRKKRFFRDIKLWLNVSVATKHIKKYMLFPRSPAICVHGLRRPSIFLKIQRWSCICCGGSHSVDLLPLSVQTATLIKHTLRYTCSLWWGIVSFIGSFYVVLFLYAICFFYWFYIFYCKALWEVVVFFWKCCINKTDIDMFTQTRQDPSLWLYNRAMTFMHINARRL